MTQRKVMDKSVLMDMSWQIKIAPDLSSLIGVIALDEGSEQAILCSLAAVQPAFAADVLPAADVRYPIWLRFLIVVGSASLLWAGIIELVRAFI